MGSAVLTYLYKSRADQSRERERERYIWDFFVWYPHHKNTKIFFDLEEMLCLVERTKPNATALAGKQSWHAIYSGNGHFEHLYYAIRLGRRLVYNIAALCRTHGPRHRHTPLTIISARRERQKKGKKSNGDKEGLHIGGPRVLCCRAAYIYYPHCHFGIAIGVASASSYFISHCPYPWSPMDHCVDYFHLRLTSPRMFFLFCFFLWLPSKLN